MSHSSSIQNMLLTFCSFAAASIAPVSHAYQRAPEPGMRKLGKPQAVIFDADGTLLDSLPPHVDFCHAMNAELGLGLTLPARTDVTACRQIASAPMDNFFRSAGFPEATIACCVEAYETRFAAECPVVPFAGIDDLIALLAQSVPCAIVSSNTAANVRAGLGSELSARFAFIDGIDNAPADKQVAITAALGRLGFAPSAVAYVGDTRKDCVKATGAGVRFIGVDFGFEALARDRSAVRGAPVAESVSELEAILLGMVLS